MQPAAGSPIEPGIHCMTAATYHSLETPTPALSSSIARKLLGYSPLHAWYAHPYLGAGAREEREAFDNGTAAHAYLLEGESGFAIIDAPDYRSKVAQALRDEARAAGKLPVLACRWRDVQAMATAAREQLAAHEPPTPFTNGRPEETLIWKEGDIWLKARLDWLHHGGLFCDDYKTTSATANPEVWCRGVFSSGTAIQAAFYVRGIRAVLGVDATLRFVVQENYPPYALSVVSLGPDAMTLAMKKVLFAIDLWRECLYSGKWPGYTTRTAFAALPPWEEASWLAREEASL